MPELSSKAEKKQDTEGKQEENSATEEQESAPPLSNTTGEPTSVIESIGKISSVIPDQSIPQIPSTGNIVLDSSATSSPVITSLSRGLNTSFGIVTTSATSRGRKRTAMSRLPAKLKEPAAVARRNARERRRVKMVNDGFMRLRKHVPTDPKNKKLSKVKTLRLAIDYIKHLQQMLIDSSAAATCKPSQILTGYSQMAGIGDELDAPGSSWLHPESMTRAHRDLDDDIFQTINPARLRTAF